MANKKTVRQKAKPAATTDKFPDVRVQFNALQAEREAVVAKLAPLRAKRDKLRDELSKKEADLRAMNKQLLESDENRRLFELDNQIGALARGMGAKSMSQPAGE